MRRFVRASTAGFAIAALLLLGVPGALAGTPVPDPSFLQPPPLPGSICQAVGPSTVFCRIDLVNEFVDEPLFPTACGDVLQSGSERLAVVRRYEGGKLVSRLIRGHFDGRWHIAPGDGGPSIDFTGNWSTTYVWATPGDDATMVATDRGLEFKASTPGVGAQLMLAGRIGPDLEVHGINTIDEPLGTISPIAVEVLEGILCN
jgi:hypothetical protein